MSLPRPGFCVGELVGIDSVMRPDLNCPSTEVIGMTFHTKTIVNGTRYRGWVYRVAVNPKQWCEPALRKLPPDPEQSFKNLMSRIKDKDTADSIT